MQLYSTPSRTRKILGFLVYVSLAMGRAGGVLNGADQTPNLTILHSLRGMVMIDGTEPDKPIRVSLRRSNGPDVGSATLKYDGSFSFEGLEAGDYLFVIERQDSPTVARPLQLKPYSSPKTVFLQVRLRMDGSATIRELVKEYTRKGTPEREEAVSTVSKTASNEFQKAGEESQKGNTIKAIEHLQKAVKVDPKFYEAFNNLGVQYQKLEQWDKAIGAYQQAITIRNDSAKPHINLGNLYLVRQQTELAVESFKQALTFDPNSVVAHLALGQIYFRKQNFDLAAEHLETATRLAPHQSREGFLQLAQLYILQQEYPQARNLLTAMQDYFPEDPDARRLLSTIPVP
jgi:tetratricopeptide (TPR) repeat protein